MRRFKYLWGQTARMALSLVRDWLHFCLLTLSWEANPHHHSESPVCFVADSWSPGLYRNKILQRQKKNIRTCMSGAVNNLMKLTLCHLYFPVFFSLWLNSFFFALLDFFALKWCVQKAESGSGLHLDFIFSKTLIFTDFEVWGFQRSKTSLPISCIEVSE